MIHIDATTWGNSHLEVIDEFVLTVIVELVGG